VHKNGLPADNIFQTKSLGNYSWELGKLSNAQKTGKYNNKHKNTGKYLTFL
jgi:hypothetical protein